MKKRLFMIILSICLLLSMTPLVSAAEPELLEIPDPLLWRNYFITNLKTGEGQNFDCEIPENGAAVLIFYGPACGNSQSILAQLNECDWVNNPYVVFSASDIRRNTSMEESFGMVQEKALNILDYLDVHYARSSWIASDYATAVGKDFTTMPLVVVLTQSENGRVIRYVEQAYQNAEDIYAVLCAACPSFADYEAKREAGEVEPSHVHSFSDWQYTVEPTCTEKGEEARICECGAKVTKPVEALGHGTTSGTITKAPTETEQGEITFVCGRCGEEEAVVIPSLADSAAHSGDLNTAKPTKQALADGWAAISDTEDYFDVEPVVTAPHATGKLTDALLDSGLSYLNFVRYAANLPQLQMTDALNENAQYGAVVLAALDMGLDHYPPQPEDMDDDFYAQGYDATSTSNLHMRYGYGGNPLHYAVQGFMDDPGVNNITALGHRRWLLNPVLQNVGFGYAQSVSGAEYIPTKVFDRSGSGVDYDFISWPASGNFPTTLFEGDVAWSVSLNPHKYMTPVRDALVITLTRESDGKTWLFNSGTSEPLSPDGTQAVSDDTPYLTVNTTAYGVSNCIIFNPRGENIGDYRETYTVTISGISYSDGSPASVCYEVNFFDPTSDCLDHSYTAETVAASCANPGYTLYTCGLCGDSYMANNEPQQDHKFTTEVVAPTCDMQGYDLSVCETCGLRRMSNFTDPLGHSFESEEVAPTCEVNGYTLLTCTVCGSERLENFVDALGHDIITEKIEATCFEKGYTLSTCTRCDASSKDDFVDALPHTEVADKAVAASCTAAGLTEGKHCSVCSIVLVKQETVPALGHSWGQWETIKAATVKEEGQRKHSCTRCNAEETQSISKLTITFTDVPAKEYYAESVNWAVQNGVTTGTSATTFSPNAECTRAQVVTFLYRAAGEPAVKSTVNPFTDVKQGEYYYNAVLWAVENGITTGTSATTFSPGASCTRAQVATFLWRFRGEPAPAGTSGGFSDVAAGQYYYTAVAWAVENGVTNGVGNGKFAPDATCTRAQIVTFLYRALT